jgi:hypothetical protein
MNFPQNLEWISHLIADDYARSWSLGAWFVLPFALMGMAAQWSGLRFHSALLFGLVVATSVVVQRAIRLKHNDDLLAKSFMRGFAAGQGAAVANHAAMFPAVPPVHVRAYTMSYWERTGFSVFGWEQKRSLYVVVVGEKIVHASGDVSKLEAFDLPPEIKEAISNVIANAPPPPPLST